MEPIQVADLNLYAYVLNDPINYFDPLGMIGSPIGLPTVVFNDGCKSLCDPILEADCERCFRIKCPRDRQACLDQAMRDYAQCLRDCAAGR